MYLRSNINPSALWVLGESISLMWLQTSVKEVISSSH